MNHNTDTTGSRKNKNNKVKQSSSGKKRVPTQIDCTSVSNDSCELALSDTEYGQNDEENLEGKSQNNIVIDNINKSNYSYYRGNATGITKSLGKQQYIQS